MTSLFLRKRVPRLFGIRASGGSQKSPSSSRRWEMNKWPGVKKEWPGVKQKGLVSNKRGLGSKQKENPKSVLNDLPLWR